MMRDVRHFLILLQVVVFRRKDATVPSPAR